MNVLDINLLLSKILKNSEEISFAGFESIYYILKVFLSTEVVHNIVIVEI